MTGPDTQEVLGGEGNDPGNSGSDPDGQRGCDDWIGRAGKFFFHSLRATTEFSVLQQPHQATT
jgi:hypothetical protein